MNESKPIQKLILACEVAMQTDVHVDGQGVDSAVQMIDNSNEKFQSYEEEFRILQHKHKVQTKAYDESRSKLCQELIETKKQLDDCKYLNGKITTERDLALEEVSELRKLLSISRSALACIHKPPTGPINLNTEIPNTHQESAFKTSWGAPTIAASYTSEFIPKVI